jgi:hypothetical protein
LGDSDDLGYSHHSGVALVVILVFLVLLSGLVLAFFSRATADRQLSQRYADTVDTKLLAQGAVNMILGDLKQEISAGSTNVSIGSSTLTYPASAQSAVPSRVGTTNTLPNLVKTSISGSDFYSSTNASAFPQTAGFPPSRRASAVSTTVVSRNGRSVPKTRWNAPLLLPANRVGTEFRSPDWIYVTANGTNPTGFSPSLTKGSNNEVLGRFAYCLYDEGGLLDVNVAGYPSSLDQSPPSFDVTRKGSPGLASLRAVLSAAGFTDPAAQQATDALVSWRNASMTNSGTWPGNYLDYLRTPGRSFLKVNSTNGMADSAFVSRQELIQFVSTHSDWTNAVASSATRRDALQFLGTFSRDLQQPSNKPPTLGSADRPTIRAGASRGRLDVFAGGNTAATLEDRINPAFLEVRVQRAFTRASDGKQAVPGEPLVKYRFPLSQLKWLTCEGPAAASVVNDPSYTDANKAQRVLDVFGLTWDPANKWWTYNHGKGNGIYTLAEVASTANREPDFIELLQAAINVGSLGKSVCPEPIYVPNKLNMASARLAENFYSAGTKDELVPAMPEFQILKIATSIIDQADPDSFPTEIRMRSPIGGGGANIIATYGVERLPMINRISFHFASRDVDPANPSDQGGFGVYVVPELWNPHEETTHEGKIAPNNVPPGPVPTQFRLTLVSTNKHADYQIWNGNGGNGFNPNNTTAGIVPNNWAYSYFDPVGPWSGKPGISGTGITSYTFSSSYPGYPFTTPTPIYENAQIPPLTKSGSTWEIAAFPLIVFDPWLPHFEVVDPRIGNPLYVVQPATSTEALADAAKRKTRSNKAGTLTTPLSALGDIPQLYINTSFGNILVQLECQDAGGIWRVIDSTGELMQAASIGPDYNSMPTIDPRSDQFPPVRTYYPENGSWFDRVSFGETFRPNYVQQGNKAWRWLFNYPTTTPAPGWQAPLNSKIKPNGEMTYFLGLISQNTRTPKLATFGGSSVDVNTFYADPDGVVRGGDAMFATSAGQDMLTTALPNQARPIILNRPFRSVGELGYAFRGQPFKTLDFFSDRTNRTDGSAPSSGTDSADTALLDLFCIDQPSYETGGLVAGAISLNTRNAPVIEALLKAGSSGGVLDESPGAANSFLSSADQANIASRFVAAATTNPLSNPSEIVSRVIQGAAIPSLQNAADANFKRRREATVRLLSAGTTARVWNLMIDVIAQVGIFPPGSTNLGSDFVVQGERRVWVHLAIDRLTGEVLDSQLERVTE